MHLRLIESNRTLIFKTSAFAIILTAILAGSGLVYPQSGIATRKLLAGVANVDAQSMLLAENKVPTILNASGSGAPLPLADGNVGTEDAASTSSPGIQLTATDADGTNTGTARLGVPVTFTTTVTGSPTAYRSWTFQGAGSFHSGAIMTAEPSTLRRKRCLRTPPLLSPAISLPIRR